MDAKDYEIMKSCFELGANRTKLLISVMIMGLPKSHPELGLDLPVMLALNEQIMSLDIPCTIQPPGAKQR
jgi:hypothetical protein